MRKTNQKKPKNSKFKIAMLGAGSFAVMLTPIACYIGLNSEQFVSTTPQIISLTTGGTLAVGFSCLAVMGKLNGILKANKSLTVFAVIFILCWLLEPLLVNAKWITGMILLGQGADELTFKRMLNNSRKAQENAGRTNDIQTAVKAAIESIAEENSGRV